MTKTTNSIINKIKEYFTLISKIENKERRLSLENLCEKLNERLIQCPASSEKRFHSAFPGGLCYHSVIVTNNLIKLTESFGKGKYSLDTVYTVGLMHDLGKIGSIESNESYYIENDSQWHVEKLGQIYKVNNKLIHIQHAVRSILFLMKYQVNLSEEEIQSILIHDGPYIKENESYGHKECTLALLLHHADRLAVQEEKEN